jgi:predicted metal-dependent HD superfamily phosphohydrolase
MPGYDTCLVEAELRARSAYAEPHRRYHTERHLDDCLRQLEQVLDLMEQERRMLRWAILWHDAVYDPARSDNEERGADLACRELTACGVDEDTSGEVRRLILLTKGHRADESDRLGALLVSIDRSILGSDEARYREYVSGVRQEYAHVPEDAWRTGRAAVLRHLLDADPLYPEPTFRDRLEAQARRNMEQELKALGAG